MRNKKNFDWRIGTCVAAIALAGACVDLDVVNLNDPDRERALSSGTDVESLVSGGFQAWWQTSHHSYPAAALSTAADAHSSSWGNWGMRDSGWEPRKSYNNDPAYSYNNLAESPWLFSYRSKAAVRDGLLTLNEDSDNAQRMREELGPERTERLNVFGKFIQAMSLANLAILFDQAFIVDETTDLETLEMQPYTAVWAAAEEKFADVIQMASGGSFTIPSAWVGFNGDWSASYLAEVARAFRARYRTQVPRTPSDRDALDWAAILQDASAGISRTFAGYYEEGGNWAWARAKHHLAHYTGWARIDYRTVGPSDASGKWEEWINASADDKRPFDIDTDDRRITAAGDPQTSGTYIRYMGNSPFPADRGIYHYSNYIDWRWRPLFDNNWVGEYPDMTAAELDLIAAEANYRLGNRDAAMTVVNASRALGELPPFTDPNGVAPGGDRCVPQMADGSCGTLWDALKYEKRIELFHYGFGTEYFDDRGWGDLVTWTWEQVPVPGSELLILLMDIYSFGGPGGNSSAADFASYLDNTDPLTMLEKRWALEAWDRANTEQVGDEATRR